MPERMSPAYRTGLIHGAYQAAMPARYRPGYLASWWQYRRGFARAFRAARGLPPLERKHQALGRCWCRARHGITDALRLNPVPFGQDRQARPAPEPVQASPLDRARQAARGQEGTS